MNWVRLTGRVRVRVRYVLLADVQFTVGNLDKWTFSVVGPDGMKIQL